MNDAIRAFEEPLPREYPLAVANMMQLLADYAKVMGEIDAVNSREPFDAFAAGKLAAAHAAVLVRMREAGTRVWEERRKG